MKYLVMILMLMAGPVMAQQTPLFWYASVDNNGEILKEGHYREPIATSCNDMHEITALNLNKAGARPADVNSKVKWFICLNEDNGLRNVLTGYEMSAMMAIADAFGNQ